MERVAAVILCQTSRIRKTQTVELVGELIGPSLFPAVVAARVVRTRKCGEHCANYWCFRANGPVFAKKKPLNMCVHNNVPFYYFV